MGRCQGGFCQPRIVEIIAEELGIEVERVLKKNKGSEIIVGKTK
jgi:glycerol-3-phosphate dehydrogenase